MNLHYEDINDALREAILVAGGYKTVGALMYPEDAPDHAAGKVRDALNTDRREKFSPQQVALISRLGRQNGCHAVMRFLAHDGSYADPVPIDPESEIARLQREFIEATKALGAMSKRIEVITVRAGSGA